VAQGVVATSAVRLAAVDVRKAFGGAKALDGASFEAHAGKVHALVGENGAGKSTLMNALIGAVQPDAGRLLLDGAPYRPTSPSLARSAGVAMVHQELSLCPHLTVAENVNLGLEPSRYGLVRLDEMRERARASLIEVAGNIEGSRLRPETRVADLSRAERQLVEIARAISLPDCRVIIFDEPTQSLGKREVENLFTVIQKLRARQIAILYISHFLEEVETIADTFTVLRDGQSVASGAMAGTRIADLVALMVGRKVDDLFPRSTRAPGDTVLEVDGLFGVERPRGATLALRRGEVLGIAGLVGAGRTELARAIFGLDPVKSGAVRVLGISGARSPAARIASGVGMLSEDRKGEGLAVALSIADNLTLPKLSGLGPLSLVFPRRARAVTERWMSELAIRAKHADQPVRALSGGNQQKVALARLLYQNADLFLLDEPTLGVDVASKAQIYGLIDELAVSGKAVLMISSYLPELLGVCDRIAVMRRGQLGPARPARELTEHALLTEATTS
jgi:ribose transport system ATP-binding protein